MIGRGSHPFDYERRPLSKWVTIYTDEDPRKYPQQVSVNRSSVNTRLKERIICGEVDYFQDPWMDLSDGLVSIAHVCSF